MDWNVRVGMKDFRWRDFQFDRIGCTSCRDGAFFPDQYANQQSSPQRLHERVPIFGPFGLVQQLGVVKYAPPRKFREELQQRLKTVRLSGPAKITADGEDLKIQPATSIHSSTMAHEPRQI